MSARRRAAAATITPSTFDVAVAAFECDADVRRRVEAGELVPLASRGEPPIRVEVVDRLRARLARGAPRRK